MVEIKRDIEESDEILDFAEQAPLEFWEKKQRELITSMVDYNLGTLTDLIDDKAIDLSPEYQRRFRWDDERQSKLIESFLMNVPIPPIFLNEDEYGKYSVIDGKQRLNAIHRFLQGRLKLKGLNVFSEVNGQDFYSLPSRLQTVLKTRPTLRAVIILRQSDQDVKFEVFQRLNSGGVKLNPQEIRNSTYTGNLNNLILELSINDRFHNLLGIKTREKSAIYQEMRDAEFVLRFFTFRESWADFKGGMKWSMDTYMTMNRNLKNEQINELRKDFLRTLSVVEAAFGKNAFKRWLPEKNIWKQQVLASLFDAQMFACRDLNLEIVRTKSTEILSSFKLLFENPEFRRSIDSATNTPSYFRSRIGITKELLQNTLNQ